MHRRAAATILLLPGLFGCAAATAGGGGAAPIDLRLEDVADREALAAALTRDEFVGVRMDTGLIVIRYDSVGALTDVTYSHAFANPAQTEAVEEAFEGQLADRGPPSAEGWFMVVGGSAPRVEPFQASRESRPELRNQRQVSLLLEELARRPGFRQRRVTLDLLVGVHGEVRDVRVVQSSGSAEFDAAMLDVARQVQFTPARLDRFPVSIWIRMPFRIVEQRPRSG